LGRPLVPERCAAPQQSPCPIRTHAWRRTLEDVRVASPPRARAVRLRRSNLCARSEPTPWRRTLEGRNHRVLPATGTAGHGLPVRCSR
jgi:hypothetical protein